MNNTQYPIKKNISKPGLDPKHFLHRVVRKWYWVLPFGVLGVLAGFITYKYTKPLYQASSTILMKTDEKHKALTSLFDNLGLVKNKSSLINQIGILTSHQITLKTLNQLGWGISWYKKGFFNEKDVYPNIPFRVSFINDFRPLEDVPIYITPLSESHYTIKVDAEIKIDEMEVSIQIDKKMAFGEVFDHDLIKFSLSRTKDSPKSIKNTYVLYFDSPKSMTRTYKRNLKVNLADEDSDLVYIKLQGHQPQRAIDYINELSKVYLQFGLEEKNKVADTTLHFINKQLESITDSLKVASEDFTNFRSKNKVVDLDTEATLVLEKLEDIEKEEAIGRMKLSYYSNLKTYLSDTSNLSRELVSPSIVGITDPALNALVLQLGNLYNEREVLSYSVQEGNPTLNELDKEIGYTRKTLNENLGNLLANTRLEMSNLKERKAQVNSMMTMLPKIERDLINIKRSFDLNDELYTFLLRKRAETGIIKASNHPDANILDIARKDTTVRLGPDKIKNLIFGAFLGFGLPILALFFMEFSDPRLKKMIDIESRLSVPNLGRIPLLKANDKLPILTRPNSFYAESFRKLRVNIYQLLGYDSNKVIAMHSVASGEGKSLIIANLATALAMNKKKVLLIDANLHGSQLPTFFDLDQGQAGFSDYLNKKSSIEEIISSTSVENLSLITSGTSSDNPSDLLDSRSIAPLLASTKGSFDFVLIDLPPAKIFSEAFIVGKYADANLFALKLNYSHWEEIIYINKLADKGTLKHIAVVTNGMNPKKKEKKIYQS